MKAEVRSRISSETLLILLDAFFVPGIDDDLRNGRSHGGEKYS